MSLSVASSLSPNGRVELPGFSLPLDNIPRSSSNNEPLFPNALDGGDLHSGKAQLQLTSLREFTMLRLMNQLTDKPDWHKKIFDKNITSKWKEEALNGGGTMDITESMVDWCLSELQFKAGIFDKTGAINVYNGDVVKSDIAIPESLKESLKAAVALLEDVPEREKDWHPGSDNLVLDLVHPSLFPLVYGRTRILPDSLLDLDDCIKRSGEGVCVMPMAPHSARNPISIPYSEKFQWLPCDVDISGGEGHVIIKSYINNLHPVAQRPLYAIIEQIISRTIPLWNITLTALKDLTSLVQRIKYSEAKYELVPEAVLQGEPQQGMDEDMYDFLEREEEWREQNSFVVQPEPEPFSAVMYAAKTQNPNPVDIWRDYAGRGLQIIVKLANIHLTPEKPEYKGGSWHVEGQLNEHICASAIYYYDNDNITTSRLAFRQQCYAGVHMEILYEQDRHSWLEEVFGCEQSGPGVQDVGTIDAREGRLITWPNILEHQVQPFQLVDRTRPGHRKILALFLVDPNIRIISTANVPCQQREWWSEQVQQDQSTLSSLPLELQQHIFDGVDDFPIGMEEAKELRLALMEERKVFVRMQNNGFRYHEFSLCEH